MFSYNLGSSFALCAVLLVFFLFGVWGWMLKAVVSVLDP